ncbi:hypothetical protein D7I39_20330 [Allopusillimonas ginsengisoli]|nr:hypothetical protein D7I39_20330 [Allopusillimonas ginsengisoli]
MKITKSVEINLFFIALAINFIWEMLQMPLFSYPENASLAQINLACIQASVGDATMVVIAFWFVAYLRKSRAWFLHPSASSLALFLLPGIIMTIAFEAIATELLHRWTYADSMPILPILGTGLAPLGQWLVLPPAILFILRRQVRLSN